MATPANETTEPKAKTVGDMNATELSAHITKADEAHRAWMTRHRRLLACLEGGAELLKKKGAAK